MDLTVVAHMASIKGKVPFINFFDGFRTSHEIQKIETWDYEDLKEMVDMDAVDAFRKECLINGWDDIGLTLRHAEKIKAFEANRRIQQPWLFA